VGGEGNALTSADQCVGIDELIGQRPESADRPTLDNRRKVAHVCRLTFSTPYGFNPDRRAGRRSVCIALVALISPRLKVSAFFIIQPST
jgi:hypothetical protein